MPGDTDQTEADAMRLEAALDRIARYTATHPAGHAARRVADAEPDAEPQSHEIAARLDGLIDKLRVALAGRPY